MTPRRTEKVVLQCAVGIVDEETRLYVPKLCTHTHTHTQACQRAAAVQGAAVWLPWRALVVGAASPLPPPLTLCRLPQPALPPTATCPYRARFASCDIGTWRDTSAGGGMRDAGGKTAREVAAVQVAKVMGHDGAGEDMNKAFK